MTNFSVWIHVAASSQLGTGLGTRNHCGNGSQTRIEGVVAGLAVAQAGAVAVHLALGGDPRRCPSRGSRKIDSRRNVLPPLM